MARSPEGTKVNRETVAGRRSLWSTASVVDQDRNSAEFQPLATYHQEATPGSTPASVDHSKIDHFAPTSNRTNEKQQSAPHRR
jgi:hypothetical protein